MSLPDPPHVGDDALHVGVDIGGTKTLAVLVTPAGGVLARSAAATPAQRGPAAVLDTAAGLVRQLLASAADGGRVPVTVGLGGDRAATAGGLVTVGVGAAGTIDPDTGTVRYATNSLPGWAGTRITAELTARLAGTLDDRARLAPVRVDNDVNAAALGETWAGAGRGRRHLLLVAAGTGLGGGLIRDGQVEHGARGGAGELAHLPVPGAERLRCGCGRYGHLEAIASGTGLAAAYELATGERIAGQLVAQRAAVGDTTAQAVLDQAGAALGRALAGLVTLLDPQAVLVAGGAGDALLPAALATYPVELPPAWADVPLLPAALGSDSVAVGAARLAMEDL
ncbi:ROK family protein [Micromonospora sp. NPDC003197]